MANVILLWSDCPLHIKLSKLYSFLKQMLQKIPGDFFYDNYELVL